MRSIFKNNQLLKFLSFALIILFLTSCADAVAIEECTDAEPYGFFAGLWHGFIALFTFFVSSSDSCQTFHKSFQLCPKWDEWQGKL